jgi:hypothetical protein
MIVKAATAHAASNVRLQFLCLLNAVSGLPTLRKPWSALRPPEHQQRPLGRAWLAILQVVKQLQKLF